MLDIRARKNVTRAVDPIARVLARLGFTPTVLTVTGLVITVAGAVLLAFGELSAGALVAGIGATLDIMDGVLARLTKTESRRGAFLDSFTDRVGEVAIWTGLAFHLARDETATLVMLALVGMSGSLLIPYLRAKAEGEGVNGKGGLMGRAERLLFLLIGIGLSDWLGLPTLDGTMWAMAGLTWLTVTQRFYRTLVQIGE